MQDNLRNEVRKLKVYNRIPFYEIAKRLQISKNGFYNWLKGYYDLSEENAERLKKIIIELNS